jgi:hypothetical protein
MNKTIFCEFEYVLTATTGAKKRIVAVLEGDERRARAVIARWNKTLSCRFIKVLRVFEE